MKNFWKKHKVGTVIAAYCLLLGVFLYGGVFRMIKNIREEADEVQKKIIDNEIDNKNLAKVPQLIGDYAVFSAREKDLDVILEKESEIEFIKSLENLAKETGNEISLKLIEEDDSQAKDSQAKAKPKEKDKEDIRNNMPYADYIVIRLELRGGYAELINFLQKLENLEHYANVVALELKKEENPEIKSGNPFISSGGSEKTESEENQKKEFLKSLIDLIVYIR